MRRIRSFIYLDEYKMYSISSQIFEGLTEYLVNSNSQAEHESEGIKESVLSGKTLSSILSREKGSVEKKILHDYAYTLLEEKMISLDKVLCINRKEVAFNCCDFSRYDFIKVRGLPAIFDIGIIRETMENYITIGKAFYYVTNGDAVNALNSLIEELSSSNDNQPKTKHKIKELERQRAILQEKSITCIDAEYLKRLSYLLSFGYQNQLSLSININNLGPISSFTSILNTDYLKEDIELLIHKYSRYADKEFTVFGMITQSDKVYQPSKEANASKLSGGTIRESIPNLIEAFANVEDTFLVRRTDEIVIDPIAIYREI